ncbi:uncharacterized protein [Nicotiana tomentosiformis]|uniref:uncharacterized protein n=1 Tax=Nicotiana tomentosiformis TaxID=4098 RepID=UPI00388C802E
MQNQKITHPVRHMCLVATKESQTINEALSSPKWLAFMQEEINSLHQNKAWTLVPKAPGMNIVGSRWVLKTKLKANGSIDGYKARLVAKDYSPLEGVDFEETSSPVVKSKYAAELLAKTSKALVKPICTPLSHKYGLQEVVDDPMDALLYRSIVGSLWLYDFSNAVWGGCPMTRRSTTCYNIYLGANYISWRSMKQHIVARSSAEPKYRALASTAAEMT